MNLLNQLFNAALTYPIFNVLLEFYHVLGDFGLSIVALTVLAYLCFSPFTQRQLKRARSLQTLQPEMTEINHRFFNNVRARRQAQQNLLRQQNLSPMPSL